MSGPKTHFVMVWVGDRYSVDYPTILADQIIRNASNLDEFALWCVTDRADELPEGITPIVADPTIPPSYWAKLQLFSADMPWAEGDRIVYLDLDVCVTGRLEDLVERPGISRDHGWPCYNSSVMVWDHGDHRDAWETFTPEIMSRAPGPLVPANLLPAGMPNGGDQEWLSELGGWDKLPSEWVVSYRWQSEAWPPSGAKIVQFHGEPKPADVTGGWVPDVWRIGGLTSLPEFKGVNTSEDMRLEHVRLSVQRDLEWFTGFADEGRSCVIVGGSPSVKDHLTEIKAHKRWGRRIVALNNAWRYLHKNGITPDVVVMLDARPENAEFLRGAPKSMRVLLASQCHPDVFDVAEAEGLEVVAWHNGYGDNERLLEILKPYWQGPDQRPCILVPGGSTVGLRSLWLAAYSGFRTIHLYGCDSSYTDGGAHHAYPQALNDQETILDVVRGEKRYRCAPWMIRQAAEMAETWKDLREHTEIDGTPAPVTVHVHGRGLLVDICRDLRAEARA